jgi:hypothetical protein
LLCWHVRILFVVASYVQCLLKPTSTYEMFDCLAGLDL